MIEGSTPLIFGSCVVFADGTSAELTAVEIDESWEILNLVVSKGLLRWRQRVRLPFSAVTAWSESTIDLGCTRSEAFSRGIPPVATPSRPISTGTPMALAGSKISGLLVDTQTKKVASLVVRVGTKHLRVATSDLTFEGKTLRLTVQPEALEEHRRDEDIAADAWRLLRDDRIIAPDELGGLEVSSAGGVLTLTGSFRRNHTKERAESLVSGVAGITAIRTKLKDDLHLEIDIASHLNNAGIQRLATIYARSSLGEVILFGRAPTAEVADDAARIVSAVDGVLGVSSRVEIVSESAARPDTAAVS